MEIGADDLVRMAETLLVKQVRTPETIREVVGRVRQLSQVSDEEAEQIARRLEARGVVIGGGSSLLVTEFEPWYDRAKADIDDYFWRRYRDHLAHRLLPPKVIESVDAETDRVIGLLQNPRDAGPWRRRGMVMGHVQSGKTANYIGLLTKAADAGYRAIIVIAGIHDNLRNQTQRRIDEGFVGRDSSRDTARNQDTRIGVGLFDNRRKPQTFTSSLRDFNKETARTIGVALRDLREPAVFVIKKNASTLRSLIEWIKEHNAGVEGGASIDVPLLLIDDEADNASINVAKAGAVSTINKQIRQLLALFSRSCYVGYTATPFANIFIDPDTSDEMLKEDLFPRHFIVSLDPPSNYLSASRVFRDEQDAFVRCIDDNELLLPVGHKQHHEVSELPDSLLLALRCFVVARAIRLWRGDAIAHTSMLVNASRFTAVQAQLKRALKRSLEFIQQSIRLNAGLPQREALKDPELNALHAAFQQEFVATGATWARLQPLLKDAASPVSVFEVNSRSADALNYAAHEKDGLSAVAVGGYALSRGLTLEGLMTSYYLRNSQAYDTLMQMGRWFGYRDGYEDLCRVWMPADAIDWYAHIAESIEELREELRVMSATGATPEEFGLKVRAHPDTLIVTAANKMGSGERVEFQIGLSGKLIETSAVVAEPTWREKNIQVGAQLVARAATYGPAEQVGGALLYSRIAARDVLEFVESFKNHPRSMLTSTDQLLGYIKERSSAELELWDVAVVGRASADGADESLGVKVVRGFRTAGQGTNSQMILLSNRRRVASVGAEQLGLTAEERRAAEESFRDSLPAERRDVTAVPDSAYRLRRKRPLLMLHLLEVRGTAVVAPSQSVLAYGISFPRTEVEEHLVRYVVNRRFREEHFAAEQDDDLAELAE